MKEELIDKIITYNYNEFGNEFGDCIVDIKKEIERLNTELELYKDNEIHLNNQLGQRDNVINELEKYIEEQINLTDTTDDQDYVCNVYSFVYSKLQELKGGSSNE